MELHVTQDVFWVTSSFREKETPRQAGFLWHSGNRCTLGCSACKVGLGKVWWTKRSDVAAKLVSDADGEAKAKIDGHANTLVQSRAEDVENIAAFRKRVPNPKGFDYLPFQRAGILFALERQNVLLGDQMGLGKTPQSLGMLNGLPNVRRVVIVVPPTLRENWRREAKRWLTDPTWDVSIVEHPDEIPDHTTPGRYLVIIPDTRIGGTRNAAMRMALQTHWDVLIVDECHRFKHANSQRAQGLLGWFGRKGHLEQRGLVHWSTRKLFLSGTPLANRPIELFPILRALDPDGLGANFFRFASRYCEAKQVAIGHKIKWDFSGASNLEELQQRMRGSVMIRRLKADVLDLPPKRRMVIAIPPNGSTAVVEKERRTFERYEDEIQSVEATIETARVLEDDEAFKAAASRLTDLRKMMATEMAKERQRVAVAKAPAVVEHVLNALEESDEQKVVLFAWHTAVVEHFQHAFKEAGIKTVSLTGATSPDNKQKAVDSFQNDPTVRVFIGNIIAAGVGITLTAADLAIFAELDWVPANCLQCEDRIYRIGTTRPVLIQYLVFDGSVDAKMANTLARKMEIIERALDRQVPIPVLRSPELAPTPVRKQYPVASDMHRKVAALAVQRLAAVCDGARDLDGSGFNRFDTRFGHQLAERATQRPLTDGEVFAARKLARKYRGQLDEEIFGTLWAADVALGTEVVSDLVFGN